MQRKQFFILSLVFLSLLMPSWLWAQAESYVVVDNIETAEMNDHVLLRVYFTLEGDGIDGETAVSEATILLEDGTIYPAVLEKPPYYIALVMDASGSMEPVFDEVRQAAIALVNTAPEAVQFAVIEFDENITLLQPYTSDHAKIISAINRIEPEDSATCLFDVAYTAAQSLDQMSQDTPNRAMVLFTDGKDQLQQGNTGACSDYTEADLSDFVTNRRQSLPIYTVGIAERESDVNSEGLTQLAEASDGYFINGTEEDFSDQLQQIQENISKHWIAEAEVTPAQGIQRGGLLLKLADGSLPSPGSLLFQSSADYRQPETPVEQAIHISNFRYETLTDSFIFDTSLLNLDNAAQLLAETIDEESNVQVERVIVQNPTTLHQIRLDAGEMVAQHRYEVQVVLRDNKGNLITDEAGVPISDSYTFQYAPERPFALTIESIAIENEPARFNFESFKLEDDDVMLVIEYHTEGEGQMGQLNGRLLNQSSNQQTETFLLESTAPGMAQSPIQAENGSYTLIVNALDESGNSLTTASHSFTTTSPDNAMMRSGKAVRSNPLLLLLFILMMIIIGFFTWRIGHNLGYRTAYKKLPAGLHLSDQSKEETAVVDEIAQQAVLTLVTSPDDTLTDISRWEIKSFPFTIGREECNITIKQDRHVSRNHAQITCENNDYFIEDLASSNGTFVNDTQIAAHEPMPLRTDKGSRLQIGKTTSFIFNIETRDNDLIGE